jgi:hypothetical protein
MNCEWCRANPATTTVVLEPGHKLTRDRYKPPKLLKVCPPCRIKVEDLKLRADTPTEVIRIA